MAQLFDRKIYFDSVRASLFSGSLTQQQVDGQNAILADWEGTYAGLGWDIRWLAYALATTIHETASTMWPIAEYNGANQPYGKPDADGKCWYGRGYPQLTHKENYEKANVELGIKGTKDDCVVDPDKQLDPFISGHTLFRGMQEGWFRGDSKGRQTFARYFNATVEDAYTAREIINGDKSKVPTWSNGVSIGNLIKGYYGKFLAALKASSVAPTPQPEPEPEPELMTVGVQVTPGTKVAFYINGQQIVQAVAANGEVA